MKNTQFKSHIHAGVTALLVIVASIVFFFLMFHLDGIMEKVRLVRYILRPISLGLIFAILLLPVHKAIYRFLSEGIASKKAPTKHTLGLVNGLSILLSLVFAGAVLYILLAMVIPQVYVSIVGLVQSIPDYITAVQEWGLSFWEDNPEFQKMFLEFFNPTAVNFETWLNNEIIPNLDSLSSTLEWMKDTLLPNISGMLSNVSSLLMGTVMWLKDLLIAVIVSVYLLARKDVFAAQSKKIVYSVLPARYGDRVVEETRNAYRIMSGFINGKLLDSLIIGIITLICCNLFNFPYPALIAMIIGVTNIVPFFGPFIGAIPSAFLILLVDPLKCVYFCIFVFVLQQFDGNILGPKILGESTGLASFWVLFSIILFGGLFGFAGMVLGVPFFAIIYSIVRRLVNRGLRRKDLPVETHEYMGVTGKMAELPKDSEN